jgi:hypothetical protein
MRRVATELSGRAQFAITAPAGPRAKAVAGRAGPGLHTDGHDPVIVLHVDRKIVLGHEHASTWIDVERAWMDGSGLDVLDRARLAGRLIDRVDDDTVLAALEHLLALEIDRVLGAIGPIQEPAIRMHVARSKTLRAPGSSALVGVPSLPRVTRIVSRLSGVTRT